MAFSQFRKLTKLSVFLGSLLASNIPQAHEHLADTYHSKTQPLNALNKPNINAFFLGDSQTLGRAKEHATHSSVSALSAIWPLASDLKLNIKSNGESGRTLAGTHQAYMAISEDERKNLDWVHFQESGNQLSDRGVQNTPAKFGKELKRFIQNIHRYSPSAVISVETAYSFEAEDMKGRNWAPYNEVLFEVINKLKKEGITVLIADVNHNITKLVSLQRSILGDKRGQESVWGDKDNLIKRHYTGLGNVMVGLSVLYALGYDTSPIKLSSIPNIEITLTEKNLLLKALE